MKWSSGLDQFMHRCQPPKFEKWETFVWVDLFFLDFAFLFFTAITLYYSQKLPTLLTMLIADVKSGSFTYQSGRAGDKAKKCKTPAKSGRVGISVYE